MNELMSLALFCVAVDYCVAGLLIVGAFMPPRIAALSERAAAAAVIAIVASVGWLLLDNVRGGAPLPGAVVQLLGVVLIVGLSLPALWWLIQFLRGKFQ